MALKKHHYLLLLFFLIIPLTTIILLSPPSLPPSTTATTTVPHHRPPTLTIKLLTYNRLPSLSRCLTSLSSATYLDDTVHLHIYIDHFLNSSDVGQSLETWKKILDYVDGFEWVHGSKVVHYRTSNVGLQAQWLECWWPVDEFDFAFVVEDDVVVGKEFYLFLKKVVLVYGFRDRDRVGMSDSVFGVTLQRPRFVPGKHGNKMNLDNETRLFLYPLVGTWGQLLFPKPWKEFRLWYDDHKARGIPPFLEGMVTNGWYKKLGEKIWTPWFIKFIQSRGYFNIYTNFPNESALSVSHRDAGVNYGKSIGPDSQLVDKNSFNIDHVPMPPLTNMDWYDFCFRKVLPGRIAKHIDEITNILHTMEQQKPILLVSVLEYSEATVRNLICHFERLNIRNYMFMIPRSKSDLLADLARRGHPVIDTEEVFDSILRSKKATPKLIEEAMVKVHVIKKCLDSGFDTWVISHNMLPLTNEPAFASGGSSDNVYIGKNSRDVVVRSSSSSRRIWGEIFGQKLSDMVESLSGQNGGDFVDVVEKFSGEHGLRLKTVDDTGLCLKLEETTDVNQSLSTSTTTVSWSPATDVDIVKERLQRLGLWIVDGDLSCKAVVCHQS